jgi:hypothetical protein
MERHEFKFGQSGGTGKKTIIAAKGARRGGKSRLRKA